MSPKARLGSASVAVDPPPRLLRELRTILQGRCARYGDQIVYALSRQLTAGFGDGFSVRNLWNMVRFAETFDDAEIVHALRAQLSWTHFRRLIGIG